MPDLGTAIPVGDPRRIALGRAVFGTLIASAIFVGFAVPTKQIHVLYDHAPWENDPYDTVYSFAMFFVPLVTAWFLVQVSLCRKVEALPVSRVISITRACRLAVALMAIALLTDWIAVVLQASRSQWTADATGWLIAALAVTTVATGKVIVDLLHVPQFPAPRDSATGQRSDWLADMVIAAKRQSRWLGPLQGVAGSVVNWIDRAAVTRLPGKATSFRRQSWSSSSWHAACLRSWQLPAPILALSGATEGCWV